MSFMVGDLTKKPPRSGEVALAVGTAVVQFEW